MVKLRVATFTGIRPRTQAASGGQYWLSVDN